MELVRCNRTFEAYAQAYANYEAAYDLLNDSHYALEECQSGSYKPSEEQQISLAGMHSVLESR